MELTLSLAVGRVQVDVDGARSHDFDAKDVALAANDPLLVAADPRPYGARLFKALFAADSPALAALSALRADEGVRLVIIDDALQQLPWEYLRDPSDSSTDQGFLALRHSIVRALPKPQRATQMPVTGTPRVLVVTSNPAVYSNDEPVTTLDVARERRNLKESFRDAATPFKVRFLKPPSLDALHAALAAGNNGGTIIHFIGHGKARPGGAVLLFEDRAGNAREVAAQDFVAPARGRALLVFLNACESATTLASPVSNLAHEIVRSGVPYAIGMQFEVPEVVALRFSEFFYRFLAQGSTVEEALRAARRALWTHGNLTRVPMRAGGVLDYRAFALGITVAYTGLDGPQSVCGPANGGEAGTIDDASPEMDFDPVIARSQTFRGRAVDVAHLGRLLEYGCPTEAEVDEARRREGRDPAGAKVIVIRGEGGMGKSTLARRAAERFTWRFPQGILGISLENLPTKEALARRIGSFLLGEAFERTPETQREETAIEAVHRARALLILDNYETLTRAAEAGDRQAAARELTQFIGRLAGGESVLLITSREQVKGLAASEMLLDGLDSDSGRELFWDYARQRRHEVDETLSAQLVDKVGGHPLALELLGAAYGERLGTGLPDFIRGLDAELGRAESLYKGDRQATLGGSFDYSFQFLSQEAKLLYPKLSMFEAPFLAAQVAAIFKQPDAAKTLNELQRKSLIRGAEVGEDLLAYYLHPTARWYVGQKVDPEALAREHGPAFADLYAQLAGVSAQSMGGKTKVGVIQLARLQMPDLLSARRFMDDKARGEQDYHGAYLLQTFGDLGSALELLEESAGLAEKTNDRRHQALTLHELAGVWITRGELERAMGLYQQSLDIKEQLGDPQGKSATLYAIANVWVTRGDLDRAMGLYQQTLDIDEQHGDLQGKGATLHAMAGVWITRGELERGMGLYQQALDIQEQLGDVVGKSHTLHQMAGVWLIRGELERAIELYQQSLDIKEKLGDLQGKGATLLAVAGVWVTRGELERAMGLYQQSLDIDEQLGDLQGKSHTLQQMAGVWVTRGELERAMRLYQQSLDIYEQIGNVQGKSATLHYMAGVWVTRGELERAMGLYQQSLDIKDQLGDLQGKSVTLQAMAGVWVTRGELERAMELYQQSLDIFEELGDLKGKSAALLAIAGVWVTRGELEHAMELYQQSLVIQEQLGNLKGRGTTLHQMAGIWVTRGELERAMGLYQQSAAIDEQLGNLRGKSATLHEMAGVWFTRGELDRAMELYQQSLDITEQLGDLKGKSATLLSIANVWFTRGELERAMGLYQQSAAIYAQLGDLQGESATLLAIAGVWFTRGDLERAMDLYQRSLDIAEQLGDLKTKSVVLANMAYALAKDNRSDEALTKYAESLVISRRLNDQFGAANVLNMIGHLRTARWEYALALGAYIDSFNLAVRVGALPVANATAFRIANLKSTLGAVPFQELWQNTTGNSDLPEWLA